MTASRDSAFADELFLVDGALPDLDVLLAAAGPSRRVLVLDPFEDGVLQLARVVSQDSGLKAIHILSHGGPGTLRLGSVELNAAALPGYANALTTIASAMAETSDVLLYGCDVAQGNQGQAFIEALADALRVNVAASMDRTGAAALGGDWALESHTGTVVAAAIGLSDTYGQVLASAIPIRLPFNSQGAEVIVSQEPGASFSHTGAIYTSWDFVLPFGHQVLAVADGTVVDIRETVPDGGPTALPDADGDKNPLNDDPSLGSGGIGNLVTIRHAVDGQVFYATYMHLQESSIPVAVGDAVRAGEVIGLVGNTGSRDGTHLHFQVGSATIEFGATNYGGAVAGTDNAVPQTIADATQSQVGLVSFAGYGTDLPAAVIGPPASGVGQTITGTSNSEVLVGGAGDDTIDGRGGDDTIDGGGGTDTAIFFENREYFDITTLSGITRVVGLGVYGAGDYAYDEMFLTNVEKLQFKDTTLDVPASSNRLIIGAPYSSETLQGTDVNETIHGRGGDDTIDGGGGTDTAIFFENREYFDITTLSGITRVVGLGVYGAGDYAYDEMFLTNVEKLQFKDTTLDVPASSNRLIIGAPYSSETLQGTDVNETIHGRGGDDTIDGGGGTDTAIFFENREYFDITTLSGITRVVGLGVYGAGDYAYDEMFLTNVEKLQFKDTTLDVPASSNRLIIGAPYSSETLQGTDVNETIHGRGGDDTIDGGGGTDTAIFFENREYFDITTLSGITRVVGLGVYGAGDYAYDEMFLTNVEKLQFKDTTLDVPASSNRLIIGAPYSSETLQGTDVNETIHGRGGDDTIDGGGGTDTAIFFENREYFDITTLSGITRVVGLGVYGAGDYAYDEMFLTNVEKLQFKDTTLDVQVTITPTDYALLSANVYGSGNQTGAENLVRSFQNTLPLPDGWQAWDAYTLDANDGPAADNTGFLAGVYTKGEHIVIAYAGTTNENSKDWFDANIPAATGLVLADQVRQAAQLYQQVLHDTTQQGNALYGKEISFTGHSLGGGLASLMAVYFDRDATVFDQAFFRKSADSSPVVTALRNTLETSALPMPAEFTAQNYIAGGVPTPDGVTPSPTRLAREGNVHSYAIKGEVLSVLSDKVLEHAGYVAERLVQLALPKPLDIAADAAVGEVLKLAGNDIGKISGTDNTVFDLNGVRNHNLDWGWDLYETAVIPNPIDLHSMSLLAGVMLSPAFESALQNHKELLPSIFANPNYWNDPKSTAPNLLELLVQRQVQGGNALDVLSGDVGRIDLENGLTSVKTDPWFAAGIQIPALLNRVILAGLYEQGRAFSPGETGSPMQSVLRSASNAVYFDLPMLGEQRIKLYDGIANDLPQLLDLATLWRGAGPDASVFGDARWVLQAGSAPLNYSAASQGDAQAVLLGGDGNDSLYGGAGNDLLSGRYGNDSLVGGAGNDQLFALDGHDTLYGGAGDDLYFVSRVDYDGLFSSNTPSYSIFDSSGLDDELWIGDTTSPFNLDNFNDLTFAMLGNDLVIDLDIQAFGFPDDDNEGRIIITDQGIADNRVETLRLVGDDGIAFGQPISMYSLWSALESFGDDAGAMRLTLAPQNGVYGQLFYNSFGQIVGDALAVDPPQALSGTSGNDVLAGGSGNDTLQGLAGNDTLEGKAGNDELDGGLGIDLAVYGAARAVSAFSTTATGHTVSSALDGTDTLTHIERLQFSDISVALDLSGNAGTVAKILGAVFGPSEVYNEVYAGIGLYYIDGGMTYEALMQLAIDARLGAGAGHQAVVDLLYTNVVGVPPGEADRAYFVGLLDSGAFTIPGLGVYAADYFMNLENINLVGLADLGLEYVPYFEG